MDDFFKNLKQKLSFENLNELLTDQEFDEVSSKESKENIRPDTSSDPTDDNQDDKPCYGVLQKPNLAPNQTTVKKNIDDTSYTESSSSQKTEESPNAPEKKPTDPAVDLGLLL